MVWPGTTMNTWLNVCSTTQVHISLFLLESFVVDRFLVIETVITNQSKTLTHSFLDRSKSRASENALFQWYHGHNMTPNELLTTDYTTKWIVYTSWNGSQFYLKAIFMFLWHFQIHYKHCATVFCDITLQFTVDPLDLLIFVQSDSFMISTI